MGKFIIGLIIGVALAFGYVRWGISAPAIVELPDKLRGNIVSTAVEGELYDLSKPLATRKRALEIFFQNRPKFAAEVDAEFAYPFLNALYVKRVIREALLLRGQWDAFRTVLEKPALRTRLEEKHGTRDDQALKQAMLFEAFREKEFLSRWIEQHEGPVTRKTLWPILVKLSGQPNIR